MLNKEEVAKKLSAYFGFAQNKRSIYVGMKLDEMLSLHKISLLVILPECSSKNEEKLLRLNDDKDFHHIRYEGSFDVKLCLGYEKLKAVGIKDASLAKAIYETMCDEIKEKEDSHE